MSVALITGAASGLGKEFAKLYAKENDELVLVDKNEDGLNILKEKLLKNNPKLKVHLLIKDLTNIAEVKSVYEYTTSLNLKVTTLINAAGFGDREDFIKMDIDKQILMTNLNCNTLLYLTNVYIKEMVKNNEGHIINVSSIAGFIPGPYMCTYHATKGFVLLLGESISYELKGTNVKLLTLCPGPFNSNFVKLAHNDFTFSKIKPVEASCVALYAYKMSKKGKNLAIVCLKNKLTIFITRFFNRNFVTKVSAKSIKKGV